MVKPFTTPVRYRIHHMLVGLVLIGILLLPFLSIGQAHAISKTWDGGCGADTTWSCANNWSDNIVPASGDTVTFNATSTNNSVVDASFAGTITTININSGYTGTISLSRSLTVSTTFSQAAGTFTAGSQTLTLAAFTLSGGSFTASSGTTSISGAMTISGSPTFNANGGTFNFNAGANATLSCNSVTFNLVTITATAGTTTVNSNCSLPLGANPSIAATAAITLNGTLSGSGTLAKSTTGGLTFASGSSLSGFTGLNISGASLSIQGTYNFSSYTPFIVGGSFTLSSGASFTAPSGTASFTGAFTINSGATFNANGGTVDFGGTTNATLACGGKTFNLVTLTHTAGTKTVSSDCSLPLGNNPNANSGGSITNNGTLSGTGTFTTSGIFTFGVGSTVSGFTGRIAAGLTINGNANYGSYTTFTVSGTFTLNSGASITMPAATASFASTFTINSGATFNANGGTVDFNGTASATLSCGSKTFNLVTFTHTAGFKTVSSDCSLPLGANPTIGSGTAALTLSGTLSGTGTLTTIGALNLGVGGSLSGFSGLSTGTLIVNGTYNFGSYSPFTVAGTFTLGATSNFTAPSGTASFASIFTINSGAVFNANGGTINFNRTVTTTVTLTCSNAVFNLVTFTNTAGATESVSSDCSFPLGNNPTVSNGGSVTLNGTLSGSGTMNKVGGLTLNAGGVLSGFSGLTDSSNLTINGTYNFGSYSPFTVAGIFTLNSGAVFTAPSGTASFGGNFTLNSGSTFNANGGTINFNSSISQAITCNNAVFNLVTIVSTGTTTVGSTCNLPLGNDPYVQSDGGTIILNGTLSGTGTLHHAVGPSTGGQFNIRDGYALSGFTGLITGRALNSSVTGTADLSNLTTLILGINYLSDPSNGGGLLVQNGGTFIAPAAMSIYGAFDIVSGSTFNANGGTVNLVGGDQTIIGNTTFYNLTKTVSSAYTLTFTAGSTTTVLGRLTLQGGSGGLLSLVSDVAGSAWFIDADGTTSVSYVDVSDSNASGGPAITTCNSVDSGGNSNWIFNPSSCNPSHGSGSSTAVTNFELAQALLIIQSNQSSHNQAAAAGAAGSGSLPSKIYDFVGRFPHGKALIRAATDLLKALLLIVFLLGVFTGLFIAWRHRKQEEEDEEFTRFPPPPTASTPTPLAGTTIRPSVPREYIKSKTDIGDQP